MSFDLLSNLISKIFSIKVLVSYTKKLEITRLEINPDKLQPHETKIESSGLIRKKKIAITLNCFTGKIEQVPLNF